MQPGDISREQCHDLQPRAARPQHCSERPAARRAPPQSRPAGTKRSPRKSPTPKPSRQRGARPARYPPQRKSQLIPLPGVISTMCLSHLERWLPGSGLPTPPEHCPLELGYADSHPRSNLPTNTSGRPRGWLRNRHVRINNRLGGPGMGDSLPGPYFENAGGRGGFGRLQEADGGISASKGGVESTDRRSCVEPSVEVAYRFDLQRTEPQRMPKETASRPAIAQLRGGASPGVRMTLSRPGLVSNGPGGLHPRQDF